MDLIVERKKISDLNCFQNTLIFGSDKLAVVYLYPTPKCTLTWLLAEDTDCYQLIDWCLDKRRIFDAYNDKYRNLKIEYWIDDEFFKAEVHQDKINRIALKKLCFHPEPVELIHISCKDFTLELLFNDANRKPYRITLLFHSIKPIEIGELFKTFHKDKRVRENPVIWKVALKIGLFNPLFAMEEVKNAEADKSIWHENWLRSRTPGSTMQRVSMPGQGKIKI